MRADFKRAFKIASVYTGVVLGAGFASGQEIIKFFVRYGYSGLAGLLVSGAIFYFVGYAVMDICISLDIRTYSGFMNRIMGKKLGLIMEIIVMIFLAVLFSTMLAAGGAAFKQAFDMNYLTGVIILSALCFITFLFDVTGVIEINALLVPALVIGGAAIGAYTAVNGSTAYQINFNFDVSYGFLKGALLYSSYNIITAITVLCALRDEARDKKTARFGVAMGGAAMTALGVCLALPLYVYKSSVSYEIPFLSITSGFGPSFEYFYLIILLAAIFTSAVGSGFAIINFFKERFLLKPIVIKIIISILSVFFAQIGFSNFVEAVYPVFGYIGLIEIIWVIIVYMFTK